MFDDRQQPSSAASTSAAAGDAPGLERAWLVHAPQPEPEPEDDYAPFQENARRAESRRAAVLFIAAVFCIGLVFGLSAGTVRTPLVTVLDKAANHIVAAGMAVEALVLHIVSTPSLLQVFGFIALIIFIRAGACSFGPCCLPPSRHTFSSSLVRAEEFWREESTVSSRLFAAGLKPTLALLYTQWAAADPARKPWEQSLLNWLFKDVYNPIEARCRHVYFLSTLYAQQPQAFLATHAPLLALIPSNCRRRRRFLS